MTPCVRKTQRFRRLLAYKKAAIWVEAIERDAISIGRFAYDLCQSMLDRSISNGQRLVSRKVCLESAPPQSPKLIHTHWVFGDVLSSRSYVAHCNQNNSENKPENCDRSQHEAPHSKCVAISGHQNLRQYRRGHKPSRSRTPFELALRCHIPRVMRCRASAPSVEHTGASVRIDHYKDG